MNTTRSQGFSAGINQATLYPLSWLQSFFAVFASPLLPTAPEYMISLNFLCLLLLLFALNRVSKLLNLTGIQSFLLYLIPLLPASLFWWKGGLIDLRRDASFVTLISASYFFLSAFILRPTILLGLICGIILGLTQWSRGNALPQILLTVFSVSAVYFFDKKLRQNWKEVLIKSFFITGTFTSLALPFYLYNLQSILLKYGENWAIGGERIQSFLDFLPSGLVIILGFNSQEIFLSILLFCSIVTSFLYLYKKKAILYEKKSFSEKYFFFLKSGILLYLIIFSFNVFVVGIKKNYGEQQGYLPFSPLIISAYSIFVFIIASFKPISSHKSQIIKAVTAISISLIIINILRIEVGKPPIDKRLHQQAQKLINDIDKDLSGKSVAYLWLEDINVHTLNFYLTQSGFDPIKTSSRININVDIENPPVSYLSISDQQKEFSQGLRTKDFIIFSQNTSLYGDKNAFFSMFVFGKPVLDELLVDDNFAKHHSFYIRDIPFMVLKNQSLTK